MQPSPKPRSDFIRPDLVRLPDHTVWRKLFRGLFHTIARLLVWLFTRPEVRGVENVPRQGPLLLVINHLGDADVIFGLTISPRPVDMLAKIDLYTIPVLGKLLDAYGMIWIHRGQADRRALRAALDGLRQGRMIGVAPEGRESLTGALEEGTGGAAYLALKSGAPILPVTFTGTENRQIFAAIKRLRRTPVTCTIGEPFYLQATGNLRSDIERGTQTIMLALARQLPPEYRGVYAQILTEPQQQSET